jgi:thymidine phosphorylase
VGSEVGPDAPLGIVHARSDGAAQAAAKALLDAYQLGKKAPETGPTVLARFAAGEEAAGGPIDDSETGDDA